MRPSLPLSPLRLLHVLLLVFLSLFLLSFASAQVSVLTTPLQCPDPQSVYADSSSGVAYATCSNTGFSTVRVISINGSIVTTLGEFPSDGQRTNVLNDPSTGLVYLAVSSGLVAINQTLGVKWIISGPQCASLSLDAASGRILGACNSPGVIAISGTNVTTLANATQCKYASSVVTDSARGIVYAVCLSGIVAINGATVQTIVPSRRCTPMSLSFDASSGRLYAVCSAGDILEVRGVIVTSIASRTQCPDAQHLTYDARSRMLIAACGGGGVIAVTDAVVTTVATLTQCVSATSVSVDANTGIVYSACGSSGIISIGGRTITNILPTALALSLPCAYAGSSVKDVKRGIVYIACSEGGVISIVGSTVTMAATADQCPYTMALAQDEKRGIVYASCVEVGLIAINGTDVTVIAADSQCGNPSSVSVDENSGVVYVSCGSGASSVIAIDGTTGTVTPLVPHAQCPSVQAVSVDSVRGLAFAACAAGGVLVINGTAVTPLIAPSSLASCWPTSLFADPTTGIVYGICRNGAASVVAITSQTVTTIATATECPDAVGVFVSGGDIFTACMDAGVLAFRGSTITTIASWSECGRASDVFVDASSSLVYATCLDSGPIAVGQNFQCSDGSYWYASECVPCPATTARLITSDQTPLLHCPTCTLGSIAPSVGSVTCTLCATGKYSTTGDICWPCLPGQFANVTGSSVCRACDAGSYGDSVGESVGCKLCRAGTFTNATGSMLCSPCDVGRYSPSLGATSCLLGPAGSFVSYSGASRMQSCSAGSFSNSTGQSFCYSCSAGQFSADNSTSCSECEMGSYSSTAGSSTCLFCSPGQHQSDTGATSCVACEAGTISAAAGASDCTECASGTISTVGSSYCSNCPAGQSSSERAIDCFPCPAGTASGGGGVQCVECAAGSYSSSNSSSSCLPCDRGTASSLIGLSTKCPPCPPGSYQALAGQSECVPCPLQYYSDTNGAATCSFCSQQVNSNRTACLTSSCRANEEYDLATSTCLTCPLGRSSTAGSSCVVCPLNTYTPMSGSDCISCQQEGMEGLSCAGGLATVKDDFFALVVIDETTGKERYQTYPCPLGFCRQTPLQQSTTSGGNYSSIQYCSSPRLNSPNNLLCGACEEGFIAWGEKCVRCERTNGGLLFAALVISLILVLFLLRSSSSPSSSGSVVVLLYFIQTSALEIGSVSQWLRWIQIFNFGTESTTSCIANWTPYEQMLFSLLMPIFLLAELLLIAAIHFALHHKYASRSEEEFTSSAASATPFSLSRLQLILFKLSSRFSVDTYIGGCFSILLFCYTQVTLSCVQFFYCVDVGGSRLVFTAPTIDCRSAEYRSYLPVVILALITFVIGLPLAIIILLGYHRRNNNKYNFSKETKEANLPSSSSSDSSPSPSLPADSPSLLFTRRFGPLYRMYSSHAWFYTPFVLLRRFSFVLTSVLLIQQPTLRFMSFALLNFFSLQLHSLIRPFTQERTNSMETASYGLLVAISVILTAFTPPYPVSVQLLILLQILLPTFFFLFSVLHEQWSQMSDRLKQSAASPAQSMEMISIDRSAGTSIVSSAALTPPFSSIGGAAAAPATAASAVPALTPASRVAHPSRTDSPPHPHAASAASQAESTAEEASSEQQQETATAAGNRPTLLLPTHSEDSADL